MHYYVRRDRQTTVEIIIKDDAFPVNAKFVITSPPGGVQSIVMSISACLSVCLSSCTSLKSHSQTSLNFFCVTCNRGSALFWRRCDMLCTSGFADDNMFT